MFIQKMIVQRIDTADHSKGDNNLLQSLVD